MALFNSNLSSSISSWFTSTFQENPDKEIQSEDDDGSTKEKHNHGSEDGEELKEKKGTDDDARSMLDLCTEQIQKISEGTQSFVISADFLGSYLLGMASEATKNVSSTVNENATALKKKVETIVGDLNQEQQEYIQRKQERLAGVAEPPWFGYHEEETMKQQILALSTDTRNFLRSPPSGVQFQFDFEQMFPVAMVTLKEDDKLRKMRFQLVPTKIKEDVFWRNYFYRVSLIKQSAQLSTLSGMQKDDSSGSSESSGSSIVIIGSTATGTMSQSRCDADSANLKPQLAEPSDLTEISDAPPAAEFASDAFDPSTLNPDDLEREMKELGMEDGGLPEWEHELQRELQEYEVVQDEGKDEVWEQEIEKMLNTSDASS